MRPKSPQQLSNIFPTRLRSALSPILADSPRLQEIRLRSGKPLILNYRSRETFLTESGACTTELAKALTVTEQEVQQTLELAGTYSLYAYEDELRQGYMTLPGGHRLGVAGKVITEGESVRNIRHLSSLNLRISHQVKGCADGVLPWLYGPEGPFHTLIISPPRCGKTTLLRDLIRQISDGCLGLRGCTVGVVDERSEIGGSYQGIPQNDLGIRTDILDACPKAEGMMMLVRSMAPEVLAVDELGRPEDVKAMETALYCGCRILATVHGSSREDLLAKPLFRSMMEDRVFERLVILKAGGPPGVVERILDGKGRVLC